MNNTTNTADHRSLYEVTGDIKDINTMLVPRSTLATPTQAAALVSPSDDGFMAAVNEMDGLYAAPAQQAAPDMTDAYAGAREDLSIWKKRALEAEALNRKFAASVNSPCFMGEPAAPVQAGEYPELPIRYATYDAWGNQTKHGYNAKDMHDYVDTDRAARSPASQPVAAPVGMEPVAWVEVRPDLDGWFLAYSFNPNAQTEPLYSGFQVQAMLAAAQQLTQPVLHKGATND